MNIKFITAQVFGVVALIFLFLSFKKNEKKYLIKMQAFSSISYALQYLFLGAYTGFIMHLLCILRNYFYNSYSYKDKNERHRLLEEVMCNTPADERDVVNFLLQDLCIVLLDAPEHLTHKFITLFCFRRCTARRGG